jgi:hypothetical protein
MPQFCIEIRMFEAELSPNVRGEVDNGLGSAHNSIAC